MSQDKIESRRAFMKKFGKFAGAAAVAAAFMATGANNAEAKPSEDNPPTGCNYGCFQSCIGTCDTTCTGACKFRCHNACDGRCKFNCDYNCSYNCVSIAAKGAFR